MFVSSICYVTVFVEVPVIGSLVSCSVTMVVVGTLVLPHGAMVFDGDENSTSAACRDRHKKLTPHMKESCSQVRNLVKFNCEF